MNNLEREIKELIIQALNLEDITIDDISSEEPLFIDGLGLDSIDALELGIALQKKYSIKIETQDENIKKYFFSVKTIAEFVGKTRVP
ncbi:MAG: acyl carrier protein [Alphaproteobacteria bacterium]|nr:acyl carrier protein [Alphaproteobacteria bacterium]